MLSWIAGTSPGVFGESGEVVRDGEVRLLLLGLFVVSCCRLEVVGGQMGWKKLHVLQRKELFITCK